MRTWRGRGLRWKLQLGRPQCPLCRLRGCWACSCGHAGPEEQWPVGEKHHDGAGGGGEAGRWCPFPTQTCGGPSVPALGRLPDRQESARVGGRAPLYMLSRSVISGPSSPRAGGADLGAAAQRPVMWVGAGRWAPRGQGAALVPLRVSGRGACSVRSVPMA